MKHLFTNFTKTLVVFNFALSGCQKSTRESFQENNGKLFGLAEPNSEISEFKSRWNEQDALDFADYVSIKIEAATDVKVLNSAYLDSPQQGDTPANISPQNIFVSGVVVVMDATSLPFLAYGCNTEADSNCRRNINSLRVEADKIIVRGAHKFPQTKVTLVANEVILENDASIDVTPLAYRKAAPPLAAESKATSGNNGKTGEKGSSIEIYSTFLDIKGDVSKSRFIANGGPGQNAGPGRNGTDGPKLPILQTDIIAGKAYGVLYYAHFQNKGHKNCAIPFGSIRCADWNFERGEKGSNQWPDGATNAIPGGAPGEGGAGGTVHINAQINQNLNTPENLRKLVSVNYGVHGTPAGIFKGGKAGTPQYSVKYITLDNGTEHARQQPVLHETKPGANAYSPQYPEKLQTPGSLIVNSGPNPKFTNSLFKTKLRLIRDRYMMGDFAFVKSHLDEGLQYASTLKSIHSDPELVETIGRYATLKSRLDLQQDYFGHALSEAPLYALDFNINHFESEVDRQLESYYLTWQILNAINKKESAAELLNKAVQQYDIVVAKEASLTNVRSSKINEMHAQLASANTQEKAFTKLLLDLEKQIEERARTSVEASRSAAALKQNVKTLASLTKIIPAAQPALAMGGSLLETLATPPESSDLLAWIDYLNRTKTGFETLTDDQVLIRSRDNLNDFIERFRTENIADKNAQEKLEYLKKIYNDLAPVFEKMKELSSNFGKNVVPADEVQATIAKIKASDPMFVESTNRLQEILKQKTQLLTSIEQINREMLESTSVVDKSLRLSIATSNEYIRDVDYQGTQVRELIKELQRDSEERLLYIYAEVLKAYRYTTLEQNTEVGNLGVLKEKTMELAKKNLTTEEAIKLMRAFYMTFINKILVTLDQKFHQNNPIMLVKNDSVLIDLESEDLVMLNKKDTTKVSLNSEIYGRHQQNIRITSIEIAGIEFDENPQNTLSRATFKSFIDISHQGSGVLVDQKGESHFYTYANAPSLHSWGSSFQFINGQIKENRIEKDQAVKGVLGLLIKNQSNTLLYSPIFSQPAGLTDLIIRKREIGSNPRSVKALQLKVNYTFVE